LHVDLVVVVATLSQIAIDKSLNIDDLIILETELREVAGQEILHIFSILLSCKTIVVDPHILMIPQTHQVGSLWCVLRTC
jgi:hypothetical protein